ncbi:MAG TPA: hypothetical protein VGI43_18570 [Mucilaginibacter sp.]|jgi:hypothetical protein
MKTSFFLTALCLMSLSIFLIWTKFEVNNHDVNISVNENVDGYSFTAHYDAARTGMVYSYLNKSISPDRLGDSEKDYFDVTTSLPDRTNFYVKESPGKLKIVLDKRRNSYASYMRIKKMCEGIKALLTAK